MSLFIFCSYFSLSLWCLLGSFLSTPSSMHTDKNSNSQLINWKSVFDPVTSTFSAIELDRGTSSAASVLRIESITTIRHDPMAMLLRPKYVNKKNTLRNERRSSVSHSFSIMRHSKMLFTCLAGKFSYSATNKALWNNWPENRPTTVETNTSGRLMHRSPIACYCRR